MMNGEGKEIYHEGTKSAKEEKKFAPRMATNCREIGEGWKINKGGSSRVQRDDSLNVGGDEGVVVAVEGGAFGLVEGADVEGMAGEFEGAGFAGAVAASEMEGLFGEPGFLGLLETELAVEGFADFGDAVDLVEAGAGGEADGILLVNEGAGEAVDEGEDGGAVGFGVVGFMEAEDVAGVFDEGVLVAAAGAEEGEGFFAGELDGAEGAFHAGIGAAGSAPEGVKAGEWRAGAVLEGGGGDPGGFEVGVAEFFGGEGDGAGDGAVGGDLEVKVADEADAEGFHGDDEWKMEDGKWNKEFTATARRARRKGRGVNRKNRRRRR
jgi:hypothetical protein